MKNISQSLDKMEPLNKTFRRKMSNTKLKLSDLNPHLMCVLCGGYYIDATTIVECLHSFCRSCIVKHLESSKYCPICEVQVHKTKPLINIRPDKTLQEIVYKLVPGLFANEMRNRRKFYKERPHYIKPNNSESVGEVYGDRKIYINDENITFSLVYNKGVTSTNVGEFYREISTPIQDWKRYFKCPTGVTIYHLKKLLKTKYELNESNYKLEIYLQDQPLHKDLTLLDISYIYLWKNKGNLDLTYKIFENLAKRQRLEDASQIRSEVPETNGQLANAQPKKHEALSEIVPVKTEVALKEEQDLQKESREVKSEAECTVRKEEAAEGKKSIKENGVSGNETKEIQLQISESGVMSVSQVQDGELVRTMEDKSPATGATAVAEKVRNNQMITGVSLGLNKGDKESGGGDTIKQEKVNRLIPEPQQKSQQQQQMQQPMQQQKKLSTKSVKPYKTIRCSPKTWHPVIPKEKLRPTLMKNSDEPKKPLKFFKMRNMPRFLGNPSSGVKPMFAEPLETNSVEDRKKQQQQQQQSQAPEKSKETTKNKILRIDPKTLRPIEKEEMKVPQAPSLPNLMTNPFIPNNNHFLFSDLHLLPPNSGNFSNSKSADAKVGSPVPGATGDKPPVVAFKGSMPNGSYPPICFPSPEHNPGFYPFSNLAKPQNFPFSSSNDKMDPLLRASRLSPFGNIAGFNMAGFHASLPPSISRLLNPHQHFRKINQSLEKKNKDESTKGTTKNCDDSITVTGSRGNEGKEQEKSKSEGTTNMATTTTTTMTTVTVTKKDGSNKQDEIKSHKKKDGEDSKVVTKADVELEKQNRENESAGKEKDKNDAQKESKDEKEKEEQKEKAEEKETEVGNGVKANENASKSNDKSESENSENVNKTIDRDKKE